MLNSLLKSIDGLSWVSSKLADLSVVILVISMIYEVTARYFFHAPTEWAFDIAYMCSGALFIFGVAWALKEDAHIKIIVVRQLLPARFNNIVDAIVYGLFLGPLFSLLFWVSSKKSWYAFVSNEVESVSPWAPKMWPFYTIISIGLLALTLQIFAQAIRALCSESTVNSAKQEKA